MIIALVILAWLGLCMGSFIGALVSRIHAKKDFIKDRSRCDSCGHVLSAKDLVPLYSWLALRGKCRYCRRPISAEAPLIELVTAVVFMVSYVFWPTNLGNGQIVLFVTWLAAAVGLLALLLYDLKWMLLPNTIIYPTLWVAVAGQLLYLLGFAPDKVHYALSWLVSLLIASGVFFVLHEVSKGKWVGFGDVRLGLITGTILHYPSKSFLMIFLASIIGTIFILPSLISGKKNMASRLPFGPYLILATWLCLLFGDHFVSWYLKLAVGG